MDVEPKRNSMRKWAAIFLVISLLIGVAMMPQFNKYGQESAMTMGLIVGFVTSKLGRKETPYDDIEEFGASE